MRRQSYLLGSGILGLAVVLGLGREGKTEQPSAQGQAQAAAAQQEGAEVLARGPVHEAFAQPMNGQPEPGPVAPKQPPEPIDEISPDQKPEGGNVQWIPGYWSWDEDRSDYIWVSGFWRVPPPERTWLAGHWQPIDKGWQWVAGFWAAANVQEVQYLPPPPPSIDEGPSTPAPDENSTYIAGCWAYQRTRYLWRPGYWVGNRPDWIWNPAHYVWTPSGCLYNDGYWDHPLDERGLLFAPVYFDRGWGHRAFIPQYVVNQDFLIGALFVRLAAQHYYFGDYFESGYATRGFVAWPDYRVGRGGYDPNYNYYRYQHAADPRWESGLRGLYRARASGAVARPPRTLGQQVQSIAAMNGNRTGNVNVHNNINLTHVQNVTALAPLNEIHNTRVTNLGSLSLPKSGQATGRVVRLEPVPKEQHAQEQKAAAQLREAAQQRRDLEGKMLSQGGVPVQHTDPPRAVRLDLPGSRPVAATPSPVQGPAQPPVQGHAPPPVQRQAPPAVPPPVQRQAPPPVQRQPPPAPVLPKHEERPIPNYQPPRPPAPPTPHKKP